jgi:cell division protein FtsB
MSMIRSRNEQEPHPVEGEVRELVRRALPRQEAAAETGINHLNSVIQRVSGASVMEIEQLITELQSARDYLQREAQRVQREVADYAQMSAAASKSTKIFAENLAQWKHTAESARVARPS